MSEIINNRKYRQKMLKELIMQLHNGKSVEDVKAKFEKLIEGISPTEISDMEQNLIMEGMPVEEVQRLCDVHAAVFKGSIQDISKAQSPLDIPGHPINTFKLENQAVEKYIQQSVMPHLKTYKQDEVNNDVINKLLKDFDILWDLDKHYKRKENILFPYLEKHGVTAPPKVMWGVDDEIRQEIKDIKNMLLSTRADKQQVIDKIEQALDKIKEMIFKEDSILFPMAVDTLTEDEWIEIEKQSDDIGYCIIQPKDKWVPKRSDLEHKISYEQNDKKGYVKFNTGVLSFDEINAILNTMPVDITFIDKDDVVKYFSEGKERIFARTKAVLGRNVQNCHPPASVHVVNALIEDFKSNKKNSEDFWIKMGELYVYIRYFAVRDEKGEYIGTLEVTQNIKPIQKIQGEKRLLSD